MRTFGTWISEITPKFNKELAEGLVYHRLRDAVDYVDSFIRYSCSCKTNTNLQYLGYEELSPKEEVKYLLKGTGKIIHDITENDLYLVKYLFRYGDESELREYYLYLPYLSKGNVIRLSGNRFLVMPTLSDKVISIGDRVIFINVLTAKYNFTRLTHTIRVDGRYQNLPVIQAELYKNQSKKLDDTTKASSTIMHYLLANYGYSATMKMLLGFVPRPVYDVDDPNVKLIESTGEVPKGYIDDKFLYEPTKIKFALTNGELNANAVYCLANVFYVLDNFPERISIDQMDDPVIWRRLMGEIIHSGNHGIGYLNEKMHAHFNDLNSSFDTITINKLQEVNIKAGSLIELLLVIFQNFNEWLMRNTTKSIYFNKGYEAESIVLNHITSRITRIALDINKEELRNHGAPLDKKMVDKVFKKYWSTRAIFGLKKDKRNVTSNEYSGDHLYFKNTSMVVQQESDFINKDKPDSNTSTRSKITAEMAAVGSILGLSKKNPTPLIRVNPYVMTDTSGTLIPDPGLTDILERTELLLSNAVVAEDIEDIGMPDFELGEEEIEDDDFDTYEEDGGDMMENLTDY